MYSSFYYYSKVHQRTEELTIALAQLDDALRKAETADNDKAVFFSFLCHELRYVQKENKIKRIEKELRVSEYIMRCIVFSLFCFRSFSFTETPYT